MRIYLSSTFADLIDHRRAVIDALRKGGYIVHAMEDYVASPQEPSQFCREDVAKCQLYLGLFAHRYGFVPMGDAQSITEQEYRTAVELGKPRFIFLLDPSQDWRAEFMDGGAALKKLQALKRDLEQQHIRAIFTTPDDLAKKVLASLLRWKTGERPLQHERYRAKPFTGRVQELAGLEERIRLSLASSTAVGFWGLRGLGGIGKSALAAEVADRLANDFPGGVLWTNLLAEEPETAAGGWLRAYGVDTKDLRPDECLARFSQLARERRPLVVLDNAQRRAQVEKLLVDAPGVAVIITTREQQNLPPEVAFSHAVNPLLEADGLTLLSQFVPNRVAGEPDAARHVCRQCGHLPVFLRVAGSALKKTTYPTVQAYSDTLAKRGLRGLDERDSKATVVFDVSYEKLTSLEQEVFAKLAHFPADDFGPNFVMALQKCAETEARELLGELEAASLLMLTGERYRFHDLVRAYAHDKLDAAVARNASEGSSIQDRVLACWTDWDFVESEFKAVGVHRLVEEYVNLDATPGTKPQAFIEWLHFIRGQSHVLVEHAELFFQEAYNQPKEGNVSKTAQARARLGYCPGSWLEWLNRATEFAPSACLQVLTGHTSPVTSVVFFDGGRRAISGSQDKTMRVWDLATGTCKAVLEGHKWTVYSVAVDGVGRRAVSGSLDGTVRVWDLTTGTCTAILEGHNSTVYSVAADGAGQRAVSGSGDGTVRLWDLATGSCLAVLKGHTAAVRSVLVDRAGRRAVSGSQDKTLRVWDLATGICTAILKGHVNTVTGVAMELEGRRVVSSSDEYTVREWDLTTGFCTAVLKGHTESVQSVAVDDGGRLAASGSLDGTVRIWDLATRTCKSVLHGHTWQVHCVALDAAGRRAISASGDNTLRVWDLVTDARPESREKHAWNVISLAVDANGQRALSDSLDGTMRVWDLATGQCVATYADGAEVRQAWDFATPVGCRTDLPRGHTATIRLGDHDGTVACAPGQYLITACSPDGRSLITSHGAGRVYIYRLRKRGETLEG